MGGCFFEAGCILTFSAFRMGANLRLGAHSNKYRMQIFKKQTQFVHKRLCKVYMKHLSTRKIL